MEQTSVDTKKLVELSDEKYSETSKTHFCTLCWDDLDKKGNLVIQSKQPIKEVMAARAKGTTPYELIDLYGSAKGVSEAFPDRGGQYGDFSDVPEMFNQEAIDRIQAKMQAQLESAIQEELAKQKGNDPAPAPAAGGSGSKGDEK